MTASPSFAAIILAGGGSRRMGADKALLRLPKGGPTLIERVAAAAQVARAAEIVVVARAGQLLPQFDGIDVRIVADDAPGAGPLAGLAVGLAAMRHDTALALACDLPYLSVPLLHEMASTPRDGWDALVPYLPSDDNPAGWEPLHAVYSRACLGPIRAALARGERRMTAPLAHLRVRPLPADDMRPHDPELRSTRSVNTPDTWGEAVRWLTAYDKAHT